MKVNVPRNEYANGKWYTENACSDKEVVVYNREDVARKVKVCNDIKKVRTHRHDVDSFDRYEWTS